MEIIIQSPGLKPGKPLENFVRQKLEKLEQHINNIMRADVTFCKETKGKLSNKYCEIRLGVPGNDHFVKKNGNSFELAVIEAIHALEHMLEKARVKHREAKV